MSTLKKLIFHYARAENILCFGSLEFHFADYGNVVEIRGINLDSPALDDLDRSNASGKSSIPEILSIALFGRTIKYPTKLRSSAILNTVSDCGEVEVLWDNYRIIRSYHKSSSGTVTSKLHVWESVDKIWDEHSEKTQGKSGDTQKWIDDRIGLTHQAFCNIVIFEDSDKNAFLEFDAADKRAFVENLLGIDIFRLYHEHTKQFIKDLKTTIESLGVEYERLKQGLGACDVRITNALKQEQTWIAERRRIIELSQKTIDEKQNLLDQSDIGTRLKEWQSFQDKIVELSATIEEMEANKSKIKTGIQNVQQKLDVLRVERDQLKDSIREQQISLSECKSKLAENEKLAGRLSGLEEGAACPFCYGSIEPPKYGHVLEHSQSEIESIRTKIVEINAKTDELAAQFKEKDQLVFKYQSMIVDAEKKGLDFDSKIKKSNAEILDLSKRHKPDGTSEEKVLETEIISLKKSIQEKQSDLNNSPYKEIIEQVKQEKLTKENEIEVKTNDLKSAEKELPYYEYWLKAFGDDGIRKYVIEGIVPALNSRILYWLQYLTDGLITLKFDNKLDPTITRNSHDVDYYSMSKSERRRINLSVSQAFAYVMMLNSGNCPSAVFLDEITGGSIDRAGIVGIYKMISELAKERQVFVTTHEENLQELLRGCDTINLKKHNDITTLIT